jgi:hypothetical protein
MTLKEERKESNKKHAEVDKNHSPSNSNFLNVFVQFINHHFLQQKLMLLISFN